MPLDKGSSVKLNVGKGLIYHGSALLEVIIGVVGNCLTGCTGWALVIFIDFPLRENAPTNGVCVWCCLMFSLDVFCEILRLFHNIILDSQSAPEPKSPHSVDLRCTWMRLKPSFCEDLASWSVTQHLAKLPLPQDSQHVVGILKFWLPRKLPTAPSRTR